MSQSCIEISPDVLVSNQPIPLNGPQEEPIATPVDRNIGWYLNLIPNLLLTDRGRILHILLDTDDPLNSVDTPSDGFYLELNQTLYMRNHSKRWANPTSDDISAIHECITEIRSVFERKKISGITDFEGSMLGGLSELEINNYYDGYSTLPAFDQLWAYIEKALDQGLIGYLARLGIYPQTFYGFCNNNQDLFMQACRSESMRSWICKGIERTVGIALLDYIIMNSDEEYYLQRQGSRNVLFTPRLHTKALGSRPGNGNLSKKDLSRCKSIYEANLPNDSLHSDIMNFTPPVLKYPSILDKLSSILPGDMNLTELLSNYNGYVYISRYLYNLDALDCLSQEEWSILQASEIVTEFARNLTGYIEIKSQDKTILRPLLTRPDLVVTDCPDQVESDISPHSALYTRIVKTWGKWCEKPPFKIYISEYKVGLSGNGKRALAERAALHRFLVIALSIFSRVRKPGQTFQNWCLEDPAFKSWHETIAPQMFRYTIYVLPTDTSIGTYKVEVKRDGKAVTCTRSMPHTLVNIPQAIEIKMPPDITRLLAEYTLIADLAVDIPDESAEDDS